ncbi:hypothetical protein [Acetivibrio clariflavus]|nr:hypothetical protein [Acetivibrio clariflavus]
MDEIKALNKQLDFENEEIDAMISELIQREEYSACTLNGCSTQLCGVNA